METTLSVNRFSSFEEAFNAASSTKEMFLSFQTGNKLDIVKKYAKEYFVDSNRELWYTTLIDGVRRLKKLEVHSCLLNQPLQYVQIMKDFLRFTGQYVDEVTAKKYSMELEVFSVYQG